MSRPKLPRKLGFEPGVTYYKPRGIPLRVLEEVVLEPDEFEAIRLHDAEGLDHRTASAKMRISQPTFSRVIDRAYHKLAEALVGGKAIRIETAERTGTQ